jgi:O-acetyl-ADP-ribose deacetylase (regulator of RNase III)
LSKVEYLTGDATKPEKGGPKFIVHVCNNIGKWGAGFTESLDDTWDKPRKMYLLEHKFYGRLYMGDVQIVKVAKDTYVLNMICQQGVWYKGRKDIPLRYDELETCLSKIFRAAKVFNASVHMPRIGCGLAGGNWEKVSKLIDKCNKDTEVFVYDNV